MATFTWTGGGNDGNIATAANWAGAASPTAAASPTIIFGATNQNITAGLSMTTTGSAIIIVTPGFGGNIGDSSGNPLTSSGNFASITYAGRGSYARFATSGTVTAASFEHSVGNVYIAGGTWTTLVNSSGNLDVAAAAVVTRLDNAAGIVVVQYNATGLTNVYNGGNMTLFRNVDNGSGTGNLFCMRGLTVQKNNGTTNYTSVLSSQVWSGAVYNKQSSGTESATKVFPGGKLLLAGNLGDASGTVTLTAVEVWSGSTVNTTAVPGVTVTVTAYTYKGASGSIGDGPA